MTIVITNGDCCETSSTLSLPLAFYNQWTSKFLYCCANSKFWVPQIEHQSSVPAQSQDDVTLSPAPLHRAACFLTFMDQSIRFQNVSMDTQLTRAHTSPITDGNVSPCHPRTETQIFLRVSLSFHHHVSHLRKTETESTSSWDDYFLRTFSSRVPLAYYYYLNDNSDIFARTC